MTVPSISGKYLQPIRVIYSGRVDSANNCNVLFEMKPTNSSNWTIEFKFWFLGNANSQFQFDLSGIPALSIDTFGYDIRIRAIENGAGLASLSSALSIEII